MTFENTPTTDIQQRPQRIRVLAEIPRETFEAISRDLSNVPDWDRFFIMNNPVSWPHGMFDVVQRHLTSSSVGVA